MRISVAWLIFLATVLSCGQKKANLAGDEPLEAEEFIESFEPVKLPFMLTDTSLSRRWSDSLLISSKIFSQFVPDSVYKSDFPKNAKLKYYALGRASVEDGETYLFVNVTTTGKAIGYLLCFDKEHIFKAGMPLIFSTGDKTVQQEGGLDRRYTVIRNRTRKKPDGSLIYNKSVYVYNSMGVFTLILTESNETVQEKEVYNPIDTLKREFAQSGNYVRDKRNFVTIRDGARAGQLRVFMHIEKNEGECIGELKGDLDLVKPNLAQYRKADDHCVLEFSFTGNAVAVRELEACGNHRGIKCVFDGSFPRKKEPRKSPAKAEKKRVPKK